MKATIGKILFVLLMFPLAGWGGAVITYHGRILDQAGRPLESMVTFRVRIYSPNPSKCLLYEEVRNVDMTNSQGVFVIPIGDGSGARGDQDPGLTIEKIFANNGEVISSLQCNSGTSYLPHPLDQRQMVVSYDDLSGYGWDHLPAMDLNYVPLALTSHDAQNLGGIPASSVLKVVDPDNPGTAFNATALTPTGFAKLLDLINGASQQYEQVGSLNGSTLPTLSPGQVLGWDEDGWSAVSPGEGVLSVTAQAPLSVDNTSSSAPKLILPKATASADGYLDKADFSSFASKLDSVVGSDLSSAHIWVGNGSGKASAALVGGDISLSNTGTASVVKLRNQPLSASAPTAEGQVLTWTSGAWGPQFIRMQDIRNTWGGAQMIPETACAQSQSMVWSAVDDRFTCQAIKNVPADNITGLATVAKSGDYNDLANKPVKASWESKSVNFTAGGNGKYFVDVSSGSVSLTLPATAEVGDEIEVLDVAGQFDVNPLNVLRNGHLIMGLAEDMQVDRKNISFSLIYSGSAHGWRIK